MSLSLQPSKTQLIGYFKRNNVVAYKGEETDTTSQSGDGLVFDYEWDADSEPDTSQNLDAARTAAFYISNMYHVSCSMLFWSFLWP